MMETQIVIGVPGLWKDRTELIQEVVSKSSYILAGNVMHHKEKEIGFEIDIYEQDPSLREAFFYAGGSVLMKNCFRSWRSILIQCMLLQKLTIQRDYKK